jgi:hypothetical protein
MLSVACETVELIDTNWKVQQDAAILCYDSRWPVGYLNRAPDESKLKALPPL